MTDFSKDFWMENEYNINIYMYVWKQQDFLTLNYKYLGQESVDVNPTLFISTA